MKKVLIAGASGLVGSALKKTLEAKGYVVYTLSYSLPTDSLKKRFHWNPEQGLIDELCLAEVDYVINLAGVGIFDKRWTSQYKQAIKESRMNSTAVLIKAIAKTSNIQAFINASAIGIYGSDTGSAWVDETCPPGLDFLANVVQAWEDEFFKTALENTRRVALRLGIVLSDKGGALPQLALPIKYGVGSPLGTGQQYISWIHITDLCELFVFALEHTSLEGSYNAVSPQPVTNQELTAILARRLNKKLFMPHVPSFFLKLLLGKEKAATLLGGNRVKGEQISQKGFEFRYKTLEEALHSFF